MKKISLVVASLLITSNLVASESFDSAIKSGSVSGDVVLYGESQSNSGTNNDAGFTNGSIGLNYETGSFNDFKGSVGFRANHDFSEVEDGDFGQNTEAIMHTANVSYSSNLFSLTVGRQEIDLEWMGDFHEAVVAGISAIPDTTIVVGYSQRKATADADAGLEDFAKFNGNKGAYVLDAKYEGISGLVLNPYFYSVPDLANWYGIKADYDTDAFGVTGHIAATNEDVSTTNDGQIIHLEARTNLSGFGINAGYITTDEDGAIGSMEAVGDNINPLEDGNQVYAADADTGYIGVSYDLSGFELGAMYGETKYANNKEKEINLTAGYGVTENFAVGALFVDVSAEDSNDDYNKVALTLEYTF